jgi:hypothetical protein
VRLRLVRLRLVRLRPDRSMPRRGRRAFLLGLGGKAALSGALFVDGQPTARAAAAPPNDELVRELEVRRAESLLLHRKVELSGLRLLRDGRLVNDSPPPVSRLLVLHLWAVECRPCIEDFPLLRRITDSLRDLPQVKAVLVAETLDLVQLQRFFDQHRPDLPRVDHYQSIDDRLRGSLQNRSQPTTLLLDALGVVRQGFVGSLKQRRSEFADSIQRLYKNL